MSEQNKIVAIDDWIEQIRRVGGEAKLARAIEARLRDERDGVTRRILNLALAGVYTTLGRYPEAERIHRMEFRNSPDEPVPLIMLAGQKLDHENQPAVAMRVIDRAIEAAFRSGNFRRHALGVKARIALEQGKFNVVEDVLRQLLALRHDSKGVDLGIDRDVFDRLPPGAIDKAVAREFDEYSRSDLG